MLFLEEVLLRLRLFAWGSHRGVVLPSSHFLFLFLFLMLICGPDFIAILGSSSISVVSKSGQPALVYFGEQ